MPNILNDFINKLNNLQRIFPEKKELKVTGFYGSSFAYFVSSLKEKLDSGNSFVFLFPKPEEAEEFYNDLLAFSNKEEIFFFPDWEILPFEDIPIHPDIISQRIAALSSIIETGKHYFLVTSVPAIFSKTISFSGLSDRVKQINEKSDLDFNDFLTFLSNAGYKRVPAVENHGEFNVRGGIVDFFPPGVDSPVRIEFLGNQAETIREFDPATQKSIKKISRAEILPTMEFIEGISSSDLFEYLPDGTVFFIAGERELKEKMQEFTELIREGRTNSEKSGVEYLAISELENKISGFAKIIFCPAEETKSDILQFDFIPLENFTGKIDDLENKLYVWQKKQFNMEIFCDNEGQKERLREMLSDGLVSSGFINFRIGRISRGFKSEAFQRVVFSEDEIWGRYHRQARYSAKKSSPFATSLADLIIDDYVVHFNHGIGIYKGLNRLDIDGRESDYMTVMYEGGDKLYLPIYEIGLVKKYIGTEGGEPKVSKLGGQNWDRVKSKVKEKAATMAMELLELYSSRESCQGFAFSPDTQWQREFEASFIYEETDDQLRATEEIKKDMQKDKPMDRLLCGDVGYGKTEVAMRVAFKTVMDGRQAAILVPTTILAEQHLNSFRERMADYPVKIEMLSRFRTGAQQKKIIENLRKGEIDIIIGTHRLIQKDIDFKNLGLIIIDEEQRFGVRHKERLKKLRKNVDVLAMTATPIPRTLYLSLSDVRDISLINTSPEGRFPVKTFVEPYNENVISQAIRRELNRQGQIFFVHNRIEDLEKISEKLKELCPRVRIGIVHGRVQEEELEKEMMGFLNKDYDLLLTTTIIESGLDISNANTIIIDHAEDFGLAQLYQLRGRVGRSHHQAYAYLFFDPARKISEDAKKRLRAIFDFTDLGSGFKIAMRDLEIRGAGNLLGKEQHGHVAEVGFELYCQILRETVEELKGKKTEQVEFPEVNLKIKAYFPDEFIPDGHQKLTLYQRLVTCQNEEEWKDIKTELEDRFGNIPEEGLNLLSIIFLKILMRRTGIYYAGEKQKNLIFKFSPKFNISLKEISRVLKGSGWEKGIKILSPEPIILELDIDKPEEKLGILQKIFLFLGKKLEYN